MNQRIKRIVAGGAAAVLITGIAAGSALAQTATPTAGQHGPGFVEALAAKLGKTPADLQSAITAIRKDRVAQAIKDGKLTQAQADAMNRRIEHAGGKLGFPGGPGTRPPHARGAGAPGNPQAMAAFLGVKPAEIRDAFLAKKTLAQFAAEKGKSRDALKDFMTTQSKARLDTAVKEGKLTQDKANAAFKKFTDNLDKIIDATGRGKLGKTPTNTGDSDSRGLPAGARV